MSAPATSPQSSPRKAAPGRPKDPGKRAAILEAASTLFVRDGFEGVSMDQIATAAGVSKLTLYSHFGDKQGLFAQVVDSFCEQALPHGLFDEASGQPLRERLVAIGTAFHAMVMRPEAIAGYRILCQPGAAAEPGFAATFWDAGPRRILQGFADLLKRHADAGELELADPLRAASQLVTLLKGEPHANSVFGLPCCMHADSADEHVAAAVDMFLRAYGRRVAR